MVMRQQSYLDPVDSITDPKLLRTKQFVRTMNWDTVVTVFWFAASIIPVVLAITGRDFFQILKVCYAPLSLLGSGIIFNFKPFQLWASNLFYFAPFALIMLPLAVIAYISPNPHWYSATIPIQFYLFWKTQRDLPAKGRREWEHIKRKTGYTDEVISAMFQKKNDETA